MIDILIPTYNRGEFLRENLDILANQLARDNLQSEFRIIVSDNNSTDATREILANFGRERLNLVIYSQPQNIGLEKNALFLLSKAKSSHVMFLGDDDFLPNGYLAFVAKILAETNAACIIPGFSSLFPDRSVKPNRTAKFELRSYRRGFITICRISSFGHQLSGLVLQRENLYETYTKQPSLSNLYPFIYFVTFCMSRGTTYFAPKYQVLVSQGNAKDWKYDDSGLLTDVFKNYQIAFPRAPLRAALASLAFVIKQPWRLRIGLNPRAAILGWKHVMASSGVDLLTKAMLSLVLPVLYVRRLFEAARAVVRIGRAK